MDELDTHLLRAIQRRIPLVAQPWEQLAAELDRQAAEIVQRIAALRQDGVIREISGIFDAAALGYQQALVALAVPDEMLAAAGAVVAEHPGVSHCYARYDDRYHL